MIKVFIGYDSNETVAYHVLSHTILKYSSQPVSITPIVKIILRIYTTGNELILNQQIFRSRAFLSHICAGIKDGQFL